MILIGSKCDLTERIEVKREELEEFSAAWGITYMEVSAKADVNIERAVLTLLGMIPISTSISLSPPKSKTGWFSWLPSVFSK